MPIRNRLPLTGLVWGILLVLCSGLNAAEPRTPAAVDGLFYSREFRLETPYRYAWSAERPQVTHGRLIVVQVHAELVRPRQAAEPVLYVGTTPAHCINIGYPSGRVVAIVPGDIDLEQEPIWFGTPALPERVDTDHALRERRLALASGIEPFAPRLVAVAQTRGGEPLVVDNVETLLLHAATLIDRHAPNEQDRVNALRARPGKWTLRQLPPPSR
jgi:hypothetical protein